MRTLKLTPGVEHRIFRRRTAFVESALQVAARIVRDIRDHRDTALLAWTKRLDKVDLRNTGIWVSPREFAMAQKGIDPEFLRAIQHAIRNVRRVAQRQLPRAWTLEVERGVKIGQIVRPIETIGCYIPGGRHALISTFVMTVVPAKVAGVKRIIVACPNPNRELLAAAGILGVSEIMRIGGAHAIASFAYGTRLVPRVNKIFGPGNRFVTAAKQIVSNDCAIDLPAGPTESIVFAARGNPEWIAADLIAQAEHAPDAASFLVTTSAKLARQVQSAIASQVRHLPSANPVHDSLAQTGAILLASSWSQAYAFVNRFAPEHLSLPGGGMRVPKEIECAGTIFLGPWAAQPLGDYASGSNHVLPTSGWARRRGGLSAADFVKVISTQSIGSRGFANLADDVSVLARAEGLLAHENAVRVRQ